MAANSGAAHGAGGRTRAAGSSTGRVDDGESVADRNEALQPLAVDARGAAALANVSRAHWLRQHSTGRVPAPVKIGRRTLWVVESLRTWFALGCPTRDEFEARVNGGGPR